MNEADERTEYILALFAKYWRTCPQKSFTTAFMDLLKWSPNTPSEGAFLSTVGYEMMENLTDETLEELLLDYLKVHDLMKGQDQT